MPDAASRATIFFEATGGTASTGWTENYWSSQADLAVLINTVRNTYVKKRVALLGVGARVKYIKAANLPANRITRVYYLTGKEGDPSLFTTQDADDTDPTQVDLLCRTIDTAGKRRQQWISGIPDSATISQFQQGITGAFISSAPWKQFVQSILDSGFGIRSIDSKGPPVTYAFHTIAEVQPIMVRNRKKGRPFNQFRGRRAV
jgi:hypothetical protein